MKVCDLHTHSVFSDGTYKPSEIIDLALDKRLAAVALCDHNTVDGLPEFLSYAADKPVEAVAGVELSVDCNGKEVHLLALYLPEQSFSAVEELMKEVNEGKERSNLNLIQSLNCAGYRLDYSKIKNSTPNGKVNRAHIAAELTQKGYTASIKHAFDTLLSPAYGHYREPERLHFLDMVGFIRSIGAAPILAHPFLNLDKEELQALLPLAKEKGLIGIECHYSLYNENTTATALALAKRLDLLSSGGSDFHGTNKPDIQLGVGAGNLKIPYEWALHIKNALK